MFCNLLCITFVEWCSLLL